MRDSAQGFLSKIQVYRDKIFALFHLLIKPFLYTLSVVAVMLFLISGLLFFLEPRSKPQDIFLSNISDGQATISWTTQKPTRGRIVLSRKGEFSLFSLFSPMHKDDGEKELPTVGFYTTHHITLGNLTPQTKYRYRIYQGWRKAYEGSFATGPIVETPTNPQPIYGRILGSDKKPVVGAIVYFQVTENDDTSALLSTLTNREGRWSLDLGNVRTSDLKKVWALSAKTTEQVLVEAGNKGRFKAETTFGQDKPWPDVILASNTQ